MDSFQRWGWFLLLLFLFIYLLPLINEEQVLNLVRDVRFCLTPSPAKEETALKPFSVLAVTPALEAHLSKLEAPSSGAWSNLMALPKKMAQQRLPFPFSPSSNRLTQPPHHYSWKKPAGAPWFPHISVLSLLTLQAGSLHTHLLLPSGDSEPYWMCISGYPKSQS